MIKKIQLRFAYLIIISICSSVSLSYSESILIKSTNTYLYNIALQSKIDSTKQSTQSTTRSSMIIYRGTDLPQIEEKVKIDSPEEKVAKEFVKGLLQCFSPDAFALIERYYALADVFHFDGMLIQLAEKDDLLSWTKNFTEEELVKSVNTTVHEICHGFVARSAFAVFQKENPVLGENERYFNFYISEKQQCLVSYTPVMLTAEMHSTFPAAFQRDRYPVYIYPSDENMGSQVNGIYGLMDEFNAYYLGTLASFDLYDYYFQEAKKDPEKWLEYIQSASSTFYAYAEFKLYILHYLWHVKKYLPQIYNGIVNNENLATAFITLDNKYKKLTEHWLTRLDKIEETCKKNEIQVHIDENYFYIGNTGVAHFKTEFIETMQEIEKNKYQQIYTQIKKLD